MRRTCPRRSEKPQCGLPRAGKPTMANTRCPTPIRVSETSRAPSRSRPHSPARYRRRSPSCPALSLKSKGAPRKRPGSPALRSLQLDAGRKDEGERGPANPTFAEVATLKVKNYGVVEPMLFQPCKEVFYPRSTRNRPKATGFDNATPKERYAICPVV